MTEQELRAQITDEILSGLKCETFKGAAIVNAICVTVVVDDAKGSQPPQAFCRFFLPDGVFIGEVPANDIVTFRNGLSQH